MAITEAFNLDQLDNLMQQRIVGFDVARALAIFGMVLVNFRIIMQAFTQLAEFCDIV